MANQDYPEQRNPGPDQRNRPDAPPDPIANTQAFRAFAREPEPEPARSSTSRTVLFAVIALVVVVAVVVIVLATR